jgi:hypothetical protein
MQQALLKAGLVSKDKVDKEEARQRRKDAEKGKRTRGVGRGELLMAHDVALAVASLPTDTDQSN